MSTLYRVFVKEPGFEDSAQSPYYTIMAKHATCGKHVAWSSRRRRGQAHVRVDRRNGLISPVCRLSRAGSHGDIAKTEGERKHHGRCNVH